MTVDQQLREALRQGTDAVTDSSDLFTRVQQSIEDDRLIRRRRRRGVGVLACFTLAAGSIVLADRYIYTLMARARVRGADDAWLRNIYGPAVIPDAVFYFELEGELLFERYLNKSRSLDYWESGLDLGLADDMFDSFNKYQSLMHNEFQKMAEEYEFDMIDANRHVFGIQKELRKSIKPFLKS